MSAHDWKNVPLPDSMSKLRRDHRGYPVPEFVDWINGVPDFRVAKASHLRDCVRYGLCWICAYHVKPEDRTFAIGPMCAINRTSAEPPSHKACATYAARVCPFLVRPKMIRRENDLPGDAIAPAGDMIRRNPGVTLLWTTPTYSLFPDRRGGVLLHLGDPTEVQWWAEGRTATRAECLESIDSGMPFLTEPAEQEGPAAVAALRQYTADAMQLLPVSP